MSKISVQNLSKKYLLSNSIRSTYNFREYLCSLFSSQSSSKTVEEFYALKNVSFELEDGDVLGIIGRNGSGKSTLLKILSRITAPTQGTVSFQGRLASLLEVGTGFHRELTGRENIFFNGAVLGMRRNEIKKKLDEIVDFSGVESFLDIPVKRYSSGMLLRLAFSVAAHLDPDILIIDEGIVVGDIDFQKKCLKAMDDLGSTGRTVIFVSHSVASIQRLCKKVLFLDKGNIISFGKANEVLTRYIHYEKEITSEYRAASQYFLGVRSLITIEHLKARISQGMVKELFSLHESIYIEISYVLEKDTALFLGIYVFNIEGYLLFMSLDHGIKDIKGTYKSICIIPPDILNEGEIFITLVVMNSENVEVFRAENIISFTIIDEMIAGKGARGNYKAVWPGTAVRPKLEWVSEFQEKLL